MEHTRIWALLLACIVLGYGIFVAHRLLSGPHVEVHAPRHGDTISDTRFTVTGTSKNINSITIAGIPVLYHQDGSFSQEYLTPDGYYEIVVVGKSPFGNTVSETVGIWGTPQHTTPLQASSTTDVAPEQHGILMATTTVATSTY